MSLFTASEQPLWDAKRTSTRRFLVLVALFACACNLSAQESSGSLHGKVSDPTGAVIPGAVLTAVSGSGAKASATTNPQGAYEIKGLAAGSYTITTTAKGFAVSTQQNVAIVAGQAQKFDIALEIAVEPEKVEVQETTTTVSTNASENASAIVLKGKDLEALSDDPDELQQELEALAGPAAGPNGGQIYIDGFTGGQLPPKSSIREIRINQNPFSAEYDKLGYGRIEIFTKPGTDQYHGQAYLDGNDSPFNSTNPFTPDVPPYHSELYNASVGGPLSKKASFFFNVEGRNINDANLVNATVLNSALQPTQQIEAIANPRTRLNLSPRVDYQLSKNNTLTIRYQFYHDSEDNDGIGQFSLPSQAYNSIEDEHTLQISDTQVLSSNVVNETRFQYVRDHSTQALQQPFTPTTMVLGAFTGGGNSSGAPIDTENRYELQNYTSVVHGTHFIKFGGRLRATNDSNISNADFNGVFTFSSLTAYQNMLLNGGTCAASGGKPPAPTPCGPSQFSITTGQPLTAVTLVDAGLYAEDDWRVRPKLTLSYGLRFETQNAIHDHGDWAPRLSMAWGLGRGSNPSPKTVLRAGFGIFYDRFAYNLLEQTERLNGITQQQTIVTNPDFYPNIPALPIPGAQVSPTIYQIAPKLRAPMTLQSAVSIERQITKTATASVTYVNSSGEHQLFLRNANAPLPGTFDPSVPGSGVRPFGGTENIYQYDSEGIYRQNQVIANFRVNTGNRVSLFGVYTLSYANSDLGAGASSGGAAGFASGGATAAPNFISNQYDPMADYGRSTFDVRDRTFLGGTIALPYAFRLSPFMIVSSGAPYDLVTGTDVNGDSIFNDRPALVSNATCATNTPQGKNIVCTPLGTFNSAPAPGAPVIPINSATGPTLFTLNFRLQKTFGFGRENKAGSATQGQGGGYGRRGGGPPGGGLGPGGLTGGGGGGRGGFFGAGNTNRRYNLTFGVSARNALNRVNLAPPVGTLSSPLFAQSIALAGGPYSSAGAVRRIDLQVLFSF